MDEEGCCGCLFFILAVWVSILILDGVGLL
jgi:hypothetical protein